MEKFIIYYEVDGNISEPKSTRAEYELNDTIKNWELGMFKCVDIETKDNKKFYHFKQGKTILTYNY